MAKKIRFPLKMNNVDIRTIEELQENFDIEAVLGYYTSGKLITWLRDRYYNEEADTIEALSADDEQFSIKLAKVLGVEIEADEELDIEEVKLRREKLEMLGRYISDRTILDNVDIVAVDQDDLYDILDSDTDKVYLFKETFIVPVGRENITYIGINGAKVKLIGILNFDKYDIFGNDCYNNYNTERFSFKNRGIKFIDIDFSEDNSTEFMYIIAQAYLDGDGVEENEELSEIWEKKLLDRCEKAAINGNSEDQYRLGFCYDVCYDQGILDDNEGRANMIEWYSKAANSGNTKAQFSLGWYYYTIKWNYDEAIHWFKKCAMENVSKAMYYLGEIYWYYLEDKEEAIKWFSKAANLEGNSSSIRGACNYLGDFYKDKDYAQALMWYKKSAELGYFSAKIRLGDYYLNEWGNEKDVDKAIEWYEKADYIDAFKKLIKIFLDGKYISPDIKKAVGYLEKWAKWCEDTSYSGPIYALGYCYYIGYGVSMDKEKASDLYQHTIQHTSSSRGYPKDYLPYGEVEAFLNSNQDIKINFSDDCLTADVVKYVSELNKQIELLNKERFNEYLKNYVDTLFSDRLFTESMLNGVPYSELNIYRESFDSVKVLIKNITNMISGKQPDITESFFEKQSVLNYINSCKSIVQKMETIIDDYDWLIYKDLKMYNELIDLYKEENTPSAWIQIGDIYSQGLCGCSKDYNEAVVWYKKAADAGDAGGYWGLARCCYYYDSPFRDYTSCMYYCNRGNEISGLMMDYSIYF